MPSVMRPGGPGFDVEVTRMTELGFAIYSGDNYFEHHDDLSVSWSGRDWTARCGHVHDDERGEGVEGDTPTQALEGLLAELDYFDAFAERVAATAATLRSMRESLGVRS